MKSGARILELRFPVGGVYKRLDIQSQPPYTAFDALNVFSDGMISERERGGKRPGLGKAMSTQLGSGNPIRLLNTVRYMNSGVLTAMALASSNGVLYKESSGTWSSISSSCTLASDRPLSSVDYLGKLYIADYGPTIASGSDGVIGGTPKRELTSTAAGNFASAGVNDDDHFVVITSHAAIDCVQTVTISGTPTGGIWYLRDPDANLNTIDIAYNASAATVQTALEGIYGAGNVGVTGSAGGPYTVTFAGDLADQPITLMEVEDDYLTGGSLPSIAVVMTTAGATTLTYAGTYDIGTVVTTTVTITQTLVALTAVNFYIGRCPKVYDPIANTLTKWLQDDYTAAEADALGSPELSGQPKGAIPIGCPIITQFNQRIYLAGGIYTPNYFFCSRQGDVDDWDFGQDDVGRAVGGASEVTGRLGEPITGMVPHQNSCMLITCKTSIWVIRGDVTAGALVNLSQHVGMLDKNAWAVTPEGIFFFLSLDGVYSMNNPCGSTPVSVSREQLPQAFLNIDLTAYTVSLAYCTRYRMLQIWIAKNSTSVPTVHYLMDYKLQVNGDAPSAAFWPITLADDTMEPFICHERRDVASDYSVVLLGGRDGYVRRFQANLAQDDGSNFTGSIWIGPFQMAGGTYEQGIASEIYAAIPANSGDIDWSFFLGTSAERASVASAFASGEWNTVGRTPSSYIRGAGNAGLIKITDGESNARWEIERIGLTILPAGRVKA
jgi:hypothetical protein